MDDSIGAFTHDEGFSASLSTMETIKLSPDDSTWMDDIIELDDETSICTSPSCKEISVRADSESTNPHHKTITRDVSSGECDCANGASGEVHTHEIEPRCSYQGKFAESDTASSHFGATGNFDSEDPKLGISQDPICASAAVCAEATKAVVVGAYHLLKGLLRLGGRLLLVVLALLRGLLLLLQRLPLRRGVLVLGVLLLGALLLRSLFSDGLLEALGSDFHDPSLESPHSNNNSLHHHMPSM